MMDTESEFGRRHIVLSKNPSVLEGFSLNRKRILESVVGAPISCVINRESLSAEVIIPTLMPVINFEPGIRSSFYSFQAVLGIVPTCSSHPRATGRLTSII
jgi:hypothetical protein